MELSDTRNRAKRKLPNFMYGATFPRDTIGSGGATYGGALEWLHKHQDYLNESLRHVQRYPNLMQEKIMDTFWDFMEPLIYNNNLLVKYDEFLQTQFGFTERYQLDEKFSQPLPTAAAYFKTDADTRRKDYTYPVRRAFFCYDRSSAHQQQLKHLIVDQLEPFLCVRTNPTREQSGAVNSMDFCRAICGSVFIMLINDNVLKDRICINLLAIAIAYKTPIIFVRESGYSLPEDIEDRKITFVKVPENAPFNPKQGRLSENTSGKKMAARDKPPYTGVSEDPEETDVGMQVLKEKERKERERLAEAETSTSLASKIRELFDNSLVFNTNMFETTLGLLYDKVASYTGASFPSAIPTLAKEAANQLSKPFNLGSMKLPRRPIYKAGTARTTVGFHDTLQARGQLPTNTNTSANNNEDEVSKHCTSLRLTETPAEAAVTGLEVKDSAKETEEQGPAYEEDTESESIGSGSLIGSSSLNSNRNPTVGFYTNKTSKKPGSTILKSPAELFTPAQPKVMRTGNLQGKFTSPYRTNGFRPSYASNSHLLSFRPGSSRPTSARSAVLLQSTMRRDPGSMEWT